jgi:hypothetical protein
VVDDISIGKNGLIVNGKQTSFVRALDELNDANEILGAGSFGVVKKMIHKITGEYYALKVRCLFWEVFLGGFFSSLLFLSLRFSSFVCVLLGWVWGLGMG